MPQRQPKSRDEIRTNGAAFAVAAAGVTIATLVRVPLAPLLGPHVPFITFFPAIVISAWVGGWRGGLTATALSTLSATYFFVPPTHSVLIKDTTDQVSLAIFVLVALCISAIGDAQQRRGRELAESEERYRRIVETTSEGVWVIDAASNTTYVNQQMARMLGYAIEEMTGTSLFDFMDEEGQAIAARHLERRRVGVEEHHDFKFRRKDGSDLWAILATNPLLDDQGQYVGTLGMLTDITERKRIEKERELLLAEQQARAEHEALINRIGQAIRSSLDADTIQETAVAELGRALAADRCYFNTADPVRGIFTVGRDWHRPGLPSLAGEYPFDQYEATLRDLFHERATVTLDDVRTSPLSPATREALEHFGVRSLLAVALYDNGQFASALAVALTGGPHAWQKEEIALAETVAEQTRGAVEAARVGQRERTIATQLQQALQPALPTAAPGLAMKSYYEAALKEAGVGGDFCDAFTLQNDCTALVVGDLAGKGLAAAAQVATVRNMVRYAIFRSRTLAGAITNLNSVLVEQELLTGFSTLFVGTFDRAAQTLTYVNCGQEPGLLRRGTTCQVDELPPTGPILGAFILGEFTEQTVTLSPGDALAIFTDGLTEVGPSRRDMLSLEGATALLKETVPEGDADDAEVIAETLTLRLISGVDAYAKGGVRDDMCLLVAVVT